MFEIKYRDGAGRIGILKYKNKKIETPILLPVINPNNSILPIEDIKKYKISAIMTNAYILYKKKVNEDIHKYLNFNGIIETDSGSYQILHYKKELEINNKEIIEYQIRINSDIINVLDLPTDIDKSREEAEKELNITVERIKEGIEIKGDKLINGAIQGGVYVDLRKKAAEIVRNLNVDIFAIGTIVPYMINYKFDKLFELIIEPKIILPFNKPAHLFGMGHTLTLPLSIYLGGDIFDSASYVLFAKDKRILTPYGTFRFDETKNIYLETKNNLYHLEELKDLDEKELIKIIAEHNLYTLIKEIEIIKDAIKNQYLTDLVLIKAHVHYSIYKATKKILEKYYEYLKNLEPVRKRSGIFYGGELNEIRVDVKRAIERLNERVDKKDIEEIYDYVYPFNSFKNIK
ncbi:MAG: tRNA guanosine(15) transglycosylase TgtA [Nanopusillaceae archaeon]|jgi:7-cyano-7-deazaguanine tRNA-ribosyltransferase